MNAACRADDGPSTARQPARTFVAIGGDDAKNHGAVIVLTGDGITTENTIEKGKAVAELVLAKLK